MLRTMLKSQDPPRDRHAGRPALRRLGHGRRGPDGRRRPAARRAGRTSSTSPTAPGSRPTSSRARAAPASSASTARPPASCTRATWSSSSPTGRWTTPRRGRYQPRVVFVDADNRIVGTGADPAEALPGVRAGARRPAHRRRPVDRAAESSSLPADDRTGVALPGRLARRRPGLDHDRRRRRRRLRHRRADRRAARCGTRSARSWSSPRTCSTPGSTAGRRAGSPPRSTRATPPTSTCATRSSPAPGCATRTPCACWSPRARRAVRELIALGADFDRAAGRRAVADPRGRSPPRPDRARRRRRDRRRGPARADRGGPRRPRHRGRSSTRSCSTCCSTADGAASRA